MLFVRFTLKLISFKLHFVMSFAGSVYLQLQNLTNVMVKILWHFSIKNYINIVD